MAWTVSHPVSIGSATKKLHFDALWDNCDFFKIDHNTDGTHKGPPIPSRIDIDVFNQTDNTNWVSYGMSTDKVYGASRATTAGAQNDEISWPIVLAAGTWTIALFHTTHSAAGIYSVQFDTVEKGTIDGYSAGTVYNVISTVTGIVVATAAEITLKLKMATKNGASTDYYGSIQHIRLRRTA